MIKLIRSFIYGLILVSVTCSCIVIVPYSDPIQPTNTMGINSLQELKTSTPSIPTSNKTMNYTPEKNVAAPTIIAPATSTKIVMNNVKPSSTSTAFPPIIHKVDTPEAKPYQVQSNTPVYVQNFAHLDKGCNWMGIAGQVIPAKSAPLTNLVVAVSGTLGNKPLDLIQLTGLATAYGPGGFEVELGTAAIASTKTLSIQLYNLQGQTISDPVTFNTYADCKKNLVLVNFTQPGDQWSAYIPMIHN